MGCVQYGGRGGTLDLVVAGLIAQQTIAAHDAIKMLNITVNMIEQFTSLKQPELLNLFSE